MTTLAKVFTTRTPLSIGSIITMSRDTTAFPCEATDNALVVGGGLASIDVVKILMLEDDREGAGGTGH